MFSSFRNWRRRRLLARLRPEVPEAQWRDVWARLPLLKGLPLEAEKRLRDLALLFLHEKSLEGAAETVVDRERALVIALQACLPILNLGLEWYDGWVSVIVYPDEFMPEREWVDADGVVWVSRQPLSGEAWQRGPVVLSWSDVEAGTILDGYNVVLHEFAHKLDMVNGSANGHPPLHRGMSGAAWKRVFTAAYGDFTGRMERGLASGIDPYAAESPGEFFAVLSELFFERPRVLRGEYPEVYRLLAEFYRQDPIARLPG